MEQQCLKTEEQCSFGLWADSGSAVWAEWGNLVGLLWGTNPSICMNYVTPMNLILERLKFRLKKVFYLKPAAPDQEFLRHASSNRQLKAEDMFKASDEVTAFEEDDELFSPAARFSTA